MSMKGKVAIVAGGGPVAAIYTSKGAVMT